MKTLRILRSAMALVVVVCFLSVGCAQQMGQSSGQTALLCGAGGALVGAAAGGAIGGNWQGALIGAAIGALTAGLTCFAIAEYKSQQVQDYRQTQQATGYQPGQGDSVQITHYEITPAAAAPGSSVAFNATYTVMTPYPDADVTVTEVRSLYVYEAQTNNWKELGRVPNQVTVKPGTRQADGKFEVRSGVAEGNYRIMFQVAKDSTTDTKNLPLIVTKNQAVLGSPEARIAQVSAPGGKPIATDPARPGSPGAAQQAPSSEPSVPPQASTSNAGPGRPLSALGEQQPQAPSTQTASVPPSGAKRLSYFVASKVKGAGSLRSGPGVTHSVIGTIAPGERYPIVGRATPSGGTWYKIRLDGGAEVWVAASLGHEAGE